MKTYVITVSRKFPTTHKRTGEPTFFIEKFFGGFKQIIPCQLCDFEKLCSGNCTKNYVNKNPKIHTIRQNVELWQKRISEIQKGNAILSIRYWSGKPYNSKQVEICQLDKNSGIGLEEVIIPCMNDIDHIKQLAMNDGLSLEDFEEWFKKYDFSKSLAIIHFTKFRYFL